MFVSSSANPDTPWEAAHFVWDYYDFPQAGLADFQGTPHVFFSWDEIYHPDPEDPEDVIREALYKIHPAPPELVAMLEEQQAIFERWHVAYRNDKEAMGHHPALPEDRARYDALKAQTDAQLKGLREAATLIQQGDFVRGHRPKQPGQSDWGTFGVRWSDPSPAPESPTAVD